MKLRNGTEENNGLVVVTTLIIKSMLEKEYEYPMAFWELVRKCKDPNYEIFGGVNKLAIINLGLMDSGGYIPQSIKNIVLSSIEEIVDDTYIVNSVIQDEDT
jgi:hypothetical protein